MDESKAAADGRTVQHAVGTTASPTIDIEKLAEKVYQLMRAEIRQARARGNKSGKRK